LENPQPYPVPHRKLQGPVMSIIIFLGIGLCLKKTLPNVGDELIAILQKNIH
jgi:hypothetical protein